MPWQCATARVSRGSLVWGMSGGLGRSNAAAAAVARHCCCARPLGLCRLAPLASPVPAAGRRYEFMIKSWANGTEHRRVFVLEQAGEFLRSHGMGVGDAVGICSDENGVLEAAGWGWG